MRGVFSFMEINPLNYLFYYIYLLFYIILYYSTLHKYEIIYTYETNIYIRKFLPIKRYFIKIIGVV